MGGESFAKAENSSNLKFEAGVIHDIDRVVALSGGDLLGGLLFRVRDAGQPQWSRRVVLMLARRMVRHYHLSRGVSERAAACALEEFVFPYCRVCGGAQEIMGANLKVVCSACGGSGRQRYTDAYRRGRVGCYGRVVDQAMAGAHRQMGDALGAFLAHANRRMR